MQLSVKHLGMGTIKPLDVLHGVEGFSSLCQFKNQDNRLQDQYRKLQSLGKD